MSDPFHIVCPHCHSVNRLPRARLNEAPNCGRCHHPLLDGRPLELVPTNFATHVQRSDLPLLVDFWAPWCGPCRSMAPVFEKEAGLFSDRVRFAKVNTEKHASLAAPFAIRGIPTMILFLGGREVDRISGALNGAQLNAWLSQRIG